MWHIEKDVVISAAHFLKGYQGPCSRAHGHNWKITVYCKANKLTPIGMVVDFADISKRIKDEFDHKILNDVLKANGEPTAEVLARRIHHMIPFCYKVKVCETDDSRCIYEPD